MVQKNTLEQVILLLADGARADMMQELLNEGKLPGIGRTFYHNREKVIDTGVINGCFRNGKLQKRNC